MSEHCIYCGERSVLLCDWLLGFTDPDGDGLYSLKGGHAMLRCDAPLCLVHAKQQAVLHVSGKHGFTDTIDHCVGHDGEDQMRAITTEQAQAFRYRHRCGAVPLRLLPTSPR
ncbi:MAG: hypothetical protein EON56_03660 [Alphaproteobacteria bacterium]|nr:MAG: hypothetical protein EON56_03660 [Alphaproteobacteria bacterium]